MMMVSKKTHAINSKATTLTNGKEKAEKLTMNKKRLTENVISKSANREIMKKD